MTDTLVLSGASLNSRTWAQALLNHLIESGIEAILFEYEHWRSGGELDIQKEAKRLREFLSENTTISKIIAKSAGSIVTMQTEQNTAVTAKNIFIGIPIEYAKDHDIQIESLISKTHTTTLCIQAESDPMGSYKQVRNLISTNSNMESICVEGEDHQYPDLGMLVTCAKEYLTK